jgi:hypothetical protein
MCNFIAEELQLSTRVYTENLNADVMVTKPAKDRA